MYIVFLKFGRHRSLAGQWMADHRQWVEQGIADGVFLMAGSLDDSQGGVVLAAHLDRDALQARIALDPFVVHEVVTAEVHAVAPSRMAPQMAAALDAARAASSAA